MQTVIFLKHFSQSVEILFLGISSVWFKYIFIKILYRSWTFLHSQSPCDHWPSSCSDVWWHFLVCLPLWPSATQEVALNQPCCIPDVSYTGRGWDSRKLSVTWAGRESVLWGYKIEWLRARRTLELYSLGSNPAVSLTTCVILGIVSKTFFPVLHENLTFI